MNTTSLKNLFTVMLTILGLTFGTAAFAGDPNNPDDDKKGDKGTQQVYEAGGGSDSGKDDKKEGNDEW